MQSLIPRGKEPITRTRWDEMNDKEEPNDNNYIFTPSICNRMALLAKVVATGKFPVLMEGETSAGKTSMIVQMAKMSGNRVYRINNHEHTDIQVFL